MPKAWAQFGVVVTLVNASRLAEKSNLGGSVVVVVVPHVACRVALGLACVHGRSLLPYRSALGAAEQSQ